MTRYLFEHLGGHAFPKTRPDWLRLDGRRLELDGYCEPLRVAFEYQGEHHYSSDAHYITEGRHLEVKARDVHKREVCAAFGVTLVEVPQIGLRLKFEDLPSLVQAGLAAAGLDVSEAAMTSIDYRNCYSTPAALEKYAELRRVCESRGGKLLSEVYLGSAAKVEVECAAGHSWRADTSNICRKWCQICANQKKALKTRVPIATLQAHAADKGGRLVSHVYERSQDKMAWECRAGHAFEATWNSVRGGSWCPYCARWSLGELEEVAKARGGSLVSRAFGKLADRYEWECANGHRWQTSGINVVNGTWCAACAGVKRLTLHDAEVAAGLRGGTCISTAYVNARTRLRWRCRQGHEWDTTLGSIRSGTWCPRCAGKVGSASEKADMIC